METYRIQIGDCVRQLPICPINENLSIAGFVMLGDVELTEACAKELLKICPEHDIIVTAETKGITCLLYTSIEVDTFSIVKRALADGKLVASPRCVPGTFEMEFYYICLLYTSTC